MARLVVDSGFSNNPWMVPLLDSQFSTATNENILISLPHPVTAAAFDPGSLDATTVTFTLTAGTHTFTFRGQDSAGGDNTALIDAVQLIA